MVLFKLLFLGYLFGIRSERQIVKDVQANVAYRWFIVRDGKPKGLFYLDHGTADGSHGIITNSPATPANVHDNTGLQGPGRAGCQPCNWLPAA